MDLIIPPKMYMNYGYDGLLWKASKVLPKDIVRLDLNSMKFIRPEAIILLIILSAELFNRVTEPVEWINIDNEVLLYLDRMEIGNLDFIRLPPIRKQFRWKKADKASINLTELHIVKRPKDCEDVMKRTKEMIIKWFPDKVGEDYCRLIPTLITEIAGNSLEHSADSCGGICYFVAQKYVTTKATQIVVAFGDPGMGIQNSLKKSNSWIAKDDLYAIKKAFNEGASCRSDRSGGLGFQQVKSVLQKYGGEVIIRSGKGVLTYNPKDSTKTKSFRESLSGTQTAFIL